MSSMEPIGTKYDQETAFFGGTSIGHHWFEPWESKGKRYVAMQPIYGKLLPQLLTHYDKSVVLGLSMYRTMMSNQPKDALCDRQHGLPTFNAGKKFSLDFCSVKDAQTGRDRGPFERFSQKSTNARLIEVELQRYIRHLVVIADAPAIEFFLVELHRRFSHSGHAKGALKHFLRRNLTFNLFSHGQNDLIVALMRRQAYHESDPELHALKRITVAGLTSVEHHQPYYSVATRVKKIENPSAKVGEGCNITAEDEFPNLSPEIGVKSAVIAFTESDYYDCTDYIVTRTFNPLQVAVKSGQYSTVKFLVEMLSQGTTYPHFQGAYFGGVPAEGLSLINGGSRVPSEIITASANGGGGTLALLQELLSKESVSAATQKKDMAMVDALVPISIQFCCTTQPDQDTSVDKNPEAHAYDSSRYQIGWERVFSHNTQGDMLYGMFVGVSNKAYSYSDERDCFCEGVQYILDIAMELVEGGRTGTIDRNTRRVAIRDYSSPATGPLGKLPRTMNSDGFVAWIRCCKKAVKNGCTKCLETLLNFARDFSKEFSPADQREASLGRFRKALLEDEYARSQQGKAQYYSYEHILTSAAHAGIVENMKQLVKFFNFEDLEVEDPKLRSQFISEAAGITTGDSSSNLLSEVRSERNNDAGASELVEYMAQTMGYDPCDLHALERAISHGELGVVRKMFELGASPTDLLPDAPAKAYHRGYYGVSSKGKNLRRGDAVFLIAVGSSQSGEDWVLHALKSLAKIVREKQHPTATKEELKALGNKGARADQKLFQEAMGGPLVVEDGNQPETQRVWKRFPLLTMLAADNRKRDSILKYLVNEMKCDINVVDDGGWTPLCHAVGNGESQKVKLLLELGARVPKVAGDGRENLLQAVAKCRNQEKLQEMRVLFGGRRADKEPRPRGQTKQQQRASLKSVRHQDPNATTTTKQEEESSSDEKIIDPFYQPLGIDLPDGGIIRAINRLLEELGQERKAYEDAKRKEGTKLSYWNDSSYKQKAVFSSHRDVYWTHMEHSYPIVPLESKK